jgi:Na+/H+-dicarboxylate symporter
VQLYTKILLGMVLGAVAGLVIGQSSPFTLVGPDTTQTVLAFVGPVGKAFLRLIQMVIVPLVFASLTVGVASLGDLRKLGRVGGRTLGLFVITTAVSVTIGLVCATLIDPGSFIDDESRATLLAKFGDAAKAKLEAAEKAPTLVDNVLAAIPVNPVGALANGDMLAIIFFALVFGIALTIVDDQYSRPVVALLDGVQNAMVVLIDLVMRLAPYGVAAIVAEVVATSGLDVLGALLVYGGTVLLALALHTVLVYVPMLRYMARLGVKHFVTAMRPALLLAFSTSSSSAAMPVTMECAEKNLGISNGVSSFSIPLGATVHMDGTALYQGVAALFIAQVFDMNLSVADQVGIVLTATLAAIGAAGVPGAGMITLAMVLTTAGIPTMGVALILGIDRLLDMFRTTVNVAGDVVVAAVVARREGEPLEPAAEPALAEDRLP